ncbi:MAG: DNA glycosylase AlkZ-like family protein [Candidatus Kariarchaeaceae archaeon]|jgi:uncharacterized protein YcaQ
MSDLILPGDFPVLSKDEFRQVIVAANRLNTWTSGLDGMQDLITRFKRIQLDPLNPAGRSHDLFFFSRINDYSMGDFEEYAYAKKMGYEGFEGYIRSFFDMTTFPTKQYEFTPEYYLRKSPLQEKYKKARREFDTSTQPLLDHLEQLITDNGITNGSEFKALDIVQEYQHMGSKGWGAGHIVNKALSHLFGTGVLTIADRDQQFRKYYDTMENYIPKKYRSSLPSEGEWREGIATSSIHTYPVHTLGKMKTATKGTKSVSRTKSTRVFTEAVDLNLCDMALLEDTNLLFTLPHNYQSLLSEDFSDDIRALSPLDPAIWDRNIIDFIFEFEYRWEVYVPEKKRIWGYYVYPLLHEDRFIGRMEVKYDKKSGELRVFNFIPEAEFSSKDHKPGILELIDRWEVALGASSVNIDTTFTQRK